MKIFISWSGPQSLAVATALKEWLPYIFTDIQSFVSSDDVRKGKRWLIEITRELSTCNFGIVCLTPANLESPWLLFEAGALSKLKSSNVCTLLVGNLRPGDIEGPLSHFQATVFSKPDVFRLTQSLNATLGRSRLDDHRLKAMFDKWWGDLEKNVTDAANHTQTATEAKRSEKDILYEVLEVTREIARCVSAQIEHKDLAKIRKLLQTPVTELELSERTAAMVCNTNILRTIGQLASCTREEVRKYTGLGAAGLDEIAAKLESLGLGFGILFDEKIFPVSVRLL